MLTAIIIDDESKGRRVLKKLLENYCPEVTVVGESEDVLSGVTAIHNLDPDIVFLDIEMPNYSGFKLLELFEQPNFHIVFTTAYEQHVIKAFKTPAIGYLLKPINIDDLIKLVEIISNRNKGLKKLTEDNSLSKLAIPGQREVIYLYTNEIICIQSKGRYTLFHLIDGNTHLCTYNLKDCIRVLKQTSFIQVHRSSLINLIHIKKYFKGRDSHIVLEPQIRIDVGKQYKDNLDKAISVFLK